MTNPTKSVTAARAHGVSPGLPSSTGAGEGRAGLGEGRAGAGLVGCSNMKLRRLTRLASRHYDAYLNECGLKTTQYSLLATIADRGPLGQGELARLLSLDASTLTRNLRPLVDSGLLAVDAGVDARSRLVSVTDAGRDKRQQARAHWKRAQLAFNDVVGNERVQALHELLDDCYRILVEGEQAKGDGR